eukprot:5064057-Lingulodinium_polyedra.AAC.1
MNESSTGVERSKAVAPKHCLKASQRLHRTKAAGEQHASSIKAIARRAPKQHASSTQAAFKP